jgi:hypothetical protein
MKHYTTSMGGGYKKYLKKENAKIATPAPSARSFSTTLPEF